MSIDKYVNRIAKFKIHLVRVWAILNIPLQLTNAGLLIYLAIKENGNPLFWLIVPVFAVITICVWLADQQSLFTAETDYSFKRSKTWGKLENDVIEIKEALKRLEAKP